MPAPHATPPIREDIETLAKESRWVDALARRLVGDRHLAEDVVQETWVQAMRAESNATHSLRAVLGRIVRNVAAGMHRRENLRREHERERARRGGPDPIQPSTQDMVVRVEQQKLLAEAVLQLEEPYRRTILQRFFEGVTVRMIMPSA